MGCSGVRKAIASLAMSLALAGALVPVIGFVADEQAAAATNTAASAAINSLKTQQYYKPGAGCPGRYPTAWLAYGSWDSNTTNCKAECYAFAKGVSVKLFGNISFISGVSGYRASNAGSYNTVGTITDSPTANPSMSGLQTLMKKAYPGDVIQFKGGPKGWGSYQHTAIVEAVDDGGVTIYQHDDSGHVNSTKYSWNYFYNTYLDFDAWTSYTKGITLYHYKNYSSKFANPAPTPTPLPDSSHRNGSVVTIPNGVYTVSVSYDTNFSVDVTGGSKDNSANIQLYSSNNSVAQAFKFTRNDDGTYTIANINSGKVLDVQGASLYNFGNIIQFDSHGGDNQRWYVERCGDGSYSFRNKKSNLYLDIYNGTVANNTNISQYQGNSSHAQRFYLMPYSGGPLIEGLTLNVSGVSAQYSLTGDAVEPKPVVEKLIYARTSANAPDSGKAATWDYCYARTCALAKGKTYRVEIGSVKNLAGSANQGTVLSHDFTNDKNASEWRTVTVSGSTQSVTLTPTANSTLLFYTNKPGGGSGNATQFNNIKVYEVLAAGSDYSLSYSGNSEAGTGYVTVSLKGNEASASKSFTVVDERPAVVEPEPDPDENPAAGEEGAEPDEGGDDIGDEDDEEVIEPPAKPSLKSIAAAKRALKVSWKLSDYADGFQVAVAQNSSFTSGKKTVTTSKRSTTVKSLSAKKKYYVKVRAYVEDDDGMRYYSSWSKVKVVKTK